MDTNQLSMPSAGTIIIGLLAVLAAGALIYAIGAMLVLRMRKSRIDVETDLTYPAEPANEDDRKALEQIRARQGGPSPESAAAEAQKSRGAP